MRSIWFIINPISGVGKKAILPSLIEKYLDKSKFHYSLYFTEYRGHAREISREAVIQKIDIVCIVGGDGSVNETASSLINSQTGLAIIPAGSGNGIARHLGIPIRLKKAISSLNSASLHHVDTLTINDVPAIGVSGIGFDAHIAHKFDEYHARGLVSYVKLVIREWRNYKGIQLKIENEIFSTVFLCSIANTNQFGNNFYVSPSSSLTDGKFEIVCIKKCSLFKMMQLVFLSRTKKIRSSNYVTIKKTSEITLKSNTFYGHIDGDPVLFDDKMLHIKCNPKSLVVYINK